MSVIDIALKSRWSKDVTLIPTLRGRGQDLALYKGVCYVYYIKCTEGGVLIRWSDFNMRFLSWCNKNTSQRYLGAHM